LPAWPFELNAIIKTSLQFGEDLNPNIAKPGNPIQRQVLLFLAIVLASSGIVGGTGSPEIFLTAPKRGGQASKQVPHFMHFS
jgi:hypothetical protein